MEAMNSEIISTNILIRPGFWIGYSFRSDGDSKVIVVRTQDVEGRELRKYLVALSSPEDIHAFFNNEDWLDGAVKESLASLAIQVLNSPAPADIGEGICIDPGEPNRLKEFAKIFGRKAEKDEYQQ